MTFAELRLRFDRYADSFRDAEGVLPDGMQCKYDHTFDVVRCAQKIASDEHFSPEDAFLAESCALFHDVARFEQLRRFATFSDSASGFDHGHEAVRLILSQDFLAGFSPEDFLTIVTAVELHNKKSVPDRLGTRFLPFVKLTRDADKIAILDLVVRYFSGEITLRDENLFSLGKHGDAINPEVMESLKQGRSVSYSMIRSAMDFKVCLFAWPWDLNFASSAKQILEKDLYGKLRRFLPENDPFCDRILYKAKEKLQCICSKSVI